MPRPTSDTHSEAETEADAPDGVIPADEAERLIDKHISRWSGLLERLK